MVALWLLSSCGGRLSHRVYCLLFFFFFQAEDGIRDLTVTGVQTCALPISREIADAGGRRGGHAGGRRRRVRDLSCHPDSRQRAPVVDRRRTRRLGPDRRGIRSLPRQSGRAAGSSRSAAIRITGKRPGKREGGRVVTAPSLFPLPRRSSVLSPAMQLTEAILQALQTVWSHKLRSFFTLLGIIVSVAFLIAVVAVIQGMNAYVRERLAGAIVGVNAFQIRRDPIQVGFIDDLSWSRIQRRPIIAPEDVPYVERALPDAQAIALQSGWPTPTADITWRNRTVGDAFVVGVTAPYQIVQDYQIAAGDPLTEVDVQQRRLVAVLGFDVADKLFEDAARAVGQRVRLRGWAFTIKGVIAKKGTGLGQSWDGFVMLPLTTFEALYGRRQTTVISVKMPAAEQVAEAMLRAEEAMRIAHRLRPGQDDDFSVDTAEGLISFWQSLTRVIFTVVPAVVAIGIVVGGIVIMNIMLMSVTERTREIGIRKSLGATRRAIRRQFLAESVTLSLVGGVLGLAAGMTLAGVVGAVTPLPARVTGWSVGVALGLGLTVGVLFGVYPATRASRLDPIPALRAA